MTLADGKQRLRANFSLVPGMVKIGLKDEFDELHLNNLANAFPYSLIEVAFLEVRY